MPHTLPSDAMAASRFTVAPPPHPTSRITKSVPIPTCSSPQVVRGEWETFIIQRNGRPTHRPGFRTWPRRTIAATTPTALRASSPHTVLCSSNVFTPELELVASRLQGHDRIDPPLPGD